MVSTLPHFRATNIERMLGVKRSNKYWTKSSKSEGLFWEQRKSGWKSDKSLIQVKLDSTSIREAFDFFQLFRQSRGPVFKNEPSFRSTERYCCGCLEQSGKDETGLYVTSNGAYEQKKTKNKTKRIRKSLKNKIRMLLVPFIAQLCMQLISSCNCALLLLLFF